MPDESMESVEARFARLEARICELEAEVERLRAGEQRKVLEVERLIIAGEYNRVQIDQQGILLGDATIAIAAGDAEVKLAADGVHVRTPEGKPGGVYLSDGKHSMRVDARGLRAESDGDDAVHLEADGITLIEGAKLSAVDHWGPFIELNPRGGWLRMTDPQTNKTTTIDPARILLDRRSTSLELTDERLAIEHEGWPEQDYLRLERGEIKGAKPDAPTWPGTPRFLLHGAELVLDSKLPSSTTRPWAVYLNQRLLQFLEQGEPVETYP